jgi:phospholipase/carboxylesterase
MIGTDLYKSFFIPAKKPSPFLMIVLHGKGDSLRPFKKFDSELKIAEMNYLLLNAPKPFLDGYSWYGDPPYQKEGVLRNRQKMLQLMAELTQQGWSPENIFLLGFSQGCLVSADLALNYPHKLAGVIGISGYFQFYPRWRQSLAENKATPWIFTHGRKDDVLPIKDTQFGVEKLKSAGFDVTWVETNKKHVFEESEYPLLKSWIKNQMSSRWTSTKSKSLPKISGLTSDLGPRL